MTGEHYYNTCLTREERIKFRENSLNYGKTPTQFDFYLASEYDSLFDFVSNGFVWVDTPEGNDYWFRISTRTTQVDVTSSGTTEYNTEVIVDKKETRVLTPHKFI